MSFARHRYPLPLGGSLVFVTFVLCLFRVSLAIPVGEQPRVTSASPSETKNSSLLDTFQPSVTITTIPAGDSANSTASDLYVIRAVVYEIGILTDVDNTTDESTERHEEVNISFYDPPHKDNGLLDLSGIPIPQIIASTTQDDISRQKDDKTVEEDSEEMAI